MAVQPVNDFSIGGQNAVIRLKWGGPASEMMFPGAPKSIKFALGENPKQSNWGEGRSGRYPQSRAGVEETIRDAFTRALDYKAQQAEFKAKKRPYPPREDLQLDALEEILLRVGALVEAHPSIAEMDCNPVMVLPAGDGPSAVEILRRMPDRISLVILDMAMPVMGGEETLRLLRGIQPALKVIVSWSFMVFQSVIVVACARP